jgi:hypothetical protein
MPALILRLNSPMKRQTVRHSGRCSGRGRKLAEPVFGEAGGVELINRGRDATALTVVEIGLESLRDPLLKAPTYRVVDRRRWQGVKHTALYGVITGLAEHWRAKHIVVDATGVGAGLASFLTRALPDRVTSFLFNALGSKSRLGWDLLAVVETGRFRDWLDPLRWSQRRALGVLARAAVLRDGSSAWTRAPLEMGCARRHPRPADGRARARRPADLGQFMCSA